MAPNQVLARAVLMSKTLDRVARRVVCENTDLREQASRMHVFVPVLVFVAI